MAYKSIDAWLGNFLISEVANLRDWRHDVLEAPLIKREQVSGVQYTHDYSNLRAYHFSAPPQCGRLQLLEILTAGDFIIAYVSDGQTRVKARLFEDAVATLEAQIGEKLDETMSGDVFRLESFAVVSTHMGPADGFVQLEIERIKYEYHLRKSVGLPSPIEDDVDIRHMIKEIENLWMRENPTIIDSDHDRETDDAEGRNGKGKLAVGRTQKQNAPTVKVKSTVSEPTHDLGVAATARNSTSTLQPSTTNKRRAVANLRDNGFEMEVGVNLEPPRLPSMLPATHRPLARTRRDQEERSSTTKSDLLQLMGQSVRHQPSVASNPVRTLPIPHNTPEDPDISMEVHTQAPSVSHAAQKYNLDAPTVKQQQPEQADPMVVDLPETLPPLEAARDLVPQPAARDVAIAHALTPSTKSTPVQQKPIVKSTENQSINPDPVSSSIPSSASSSRVPYGRRKIPKDQMKLLDHPSSWFPSLPGQNFPVPNVPVELLKEWSDALPQVQEEVPVDRPQRMASPSASASTDTEMISSSSSEGNLTDSEWPPTPVKRQPDLPPSSPMENIIRRDQSNDDDLEMVAPRALTLRRSPGRPQRWNETSYRHQPSSTRASPTRPSATARHLDESPRQRVRRPTSPQSSDYRSNQHYAQQQRNADWVQMQQSPRNHHSDQPLPRGPRNAYSSRQTSFVEQPRLSRFSNESTAHSSFPSPASGRADEGNLKTRSGSSRSSPEHPNSQVDSAKRIVTPPSKSGQQISPLLPSESAVTTRSPVQDPAEYHRAFRKAYFNIFAQRRNWLKENYIPDQSADIRLPVILSKYHVAFPGDLKAELDDFLSAVCQAFPEFTTASENMTFRSLMKQSPTLVHPPIPTSTSPLATEPSRPRPRPPPSDQTSHAPNLPSPIPLARDSTLPTPRKTAAYSTVLDATPPSYQPNLSSSSSAGIPPRFQQNSTSFKPPSSSSPASLKNWTPADPPTQPHAKPTNTATSAAPRLLPPPPSQPPLRRRSQFHGEVQPRQRAQPEDQQVVMVQEEQPVPIFAQFARDYLAISPGGAAVDEQNLARGRGEGGAGRGEEQVQGRRRVPFWTWQL